MKQKFSIQAINFLLTCLISLYLRAFLVGLPNFEPILGMLICLAKRFSFIELFLFGFLNILCFDLFTFNFGTWTIFTAVTYAIIGICTYFIKKNKINYISYVILSTLVYDIVTGLIMGPVLFNQDFMQALVGQIPFTIYHLIGNLIFTIGFTHLLDVFCVLKSSTFLKGEKYYHVR